MSELIPCVPFTKYEDGAPSFLRELEIEHLICSLLGVNEGDLISTPGLVAEFTILSHFKVA